LLRPSNAENGLVLRRYWNQLLIQSHGLAAPSPWSCRHWDGGSKLPVQMPRLAARASPSSPA
jgi:hypothetical protein